MGWPALLLEPYRHIHTSFMRSPIDAVHVVSDGKVLNIHQHIPPWRLARPRGSALAVPLLSGVSQVCSQYS